jgi:uncharacterized protein RhaS with RHS repeats
MESDLLHLRRRYYDPATQQFLSHDPVQNITGQPYAYAWGNPVNFTDRAALRAGLEGGEQPPPEPLGTRTSPRGVPTGEGSLGTGMQRLDYLTPGFMVERLGMDKVGYWGLRHQQNQSLCGRPLFPSVFLL